MLCWRCGAQAQDEFCPVCGCRQASRQAAATASGAALRYAYDRFGAQRMLTDSSCFKRCLSDMLPDDKAEQQRLYIVMQTSAGPRVYDLLRGSGGPSDSDCQELVRRIQDESGMAENSARNSLGVILDMIGCRNPIAVQPRSFSGAARGMDQQKDDHPSRTEVPRGMEIPRSGEISQRSGRSAQASGGIQVLAVMQNANILDATGGLSYKNSFGPTRKGRGRLLVRSDGVAWHKYTGSGPAEQRGCSTDPDFFIPRGEIANVFEHSLLVFHEFSILTRDGRQYRVEGKNEKEIVTQVVNVIRSLMTEPTERKRPF